MSTHQQEVKQGERFEFGANWNRFLDKLNEQRIESAIASLKKLLGRQTLDGQSFLDIGSGSGLFSLSARRLGAQVVSFDFDPKSVACTRLLRDRFNAGADGWQVMEGSVLDKDYLKSLGTFDIVYSWGVLHHTGQMWQAIENASRCVKPGGTFAIAIYNDQGALSKRWLKIKKVYNKLPRPLKLPYTLLVMGLRELPPLFWLTLKLKPFSYFDRYREDTGLRGMNYWHDLVDWVGGYPFEVAKPEEMFEFFKGRGFQLQTMVTMAGGVGCNEYVFTKVGDEPAVR